MKILLNCEKLKYPNTGLYQFCTDFCDAMGRTIAKDDSLAFYIAKNNRFRGEQAEYYRHRLTDSFFKRNIGGMDIYHALEQLSKLRIADRKTKMLLTVHDLNFLYEKRNPGKIKKYLSFYQNSIDRADAIVAISDYTKQDILKHIDTRGKEVMVIHNGCHVMEFPGYDTPTYRPVKPFIFAIGTVIRKKNFHVLPALLRRNDYELVIAGNKSDYVHRITEEAIRFGVADRVKIIGPVSYEDKYWYYKNCEAFVFPSIAEGFGLPPIEAMHFGKPVFLSSLTSLPEIGGDCAYYFNDFDPDSMLSVFEHGMADYISNNRTEKIKANADRFSWERCAKAYYDTYHKLLK